MQKQKYPKKNINRVIQRIDQPRRYTSVLELFEKMNAICSYGRRAFKKTSVRRHAYREVK